MTWHATVKRKYMQASALMEKKVWLLDQIQEGKGKPNSHRTGMAFPRCGSSCAHQGPASDWRPCCTLSTGMVFPVYNDNREWKWVNTEHKSLSEWNSMLDGASFIFPLRDCSQWKQQQVGLKMIKWKLGKLWLDSFHFSTHLWINFLFQSFQPSNCKGLFFIMQKVQK